MVIDDGQIDKDHQELISIANRVLALNKPDEQIEDLKQSIRELYDYVKYHFKQEEIFMQQVNYPDFADHHEKHREIIKKMNHILSHSKHMNDILNNFRNLVNDWVIRHIRKEDMKIRNFLAEQK